MKRAILIFGLISGVLQALLMVVTMAVANKSGLDRGLIVGYTAIVASFLLIYFGIRSYRDNQGNGAIGFGRAFVIGIAITVISCAFYVMAWEITYFNFMPDFMDKYANQEIQRLKDSGASAATIEAESRAMEEMKIKYKNPFYNSMLTFMEPLPVGIVITLLSAAILRKKPQMTGMPAAATAG